MWHKHTKEYYSSLESEEILAHATTRMNFEDVIISKISHSQKDKYRMIPLYMKYLEQLNL